MTGKSAHRDVALWRYERPSRGYFGLHLRAASPEARARLKDRLASLTPGTPHLLRFGAQRPDTLPWTRQAFDDLLVTVGQAPIQDDGSFSVTLTPDQHQNLLSLLDTVAPHEEASVTVDTAEGAMPLWVWWDA